MSTVEERKKNRITKALELALSLNPAAGAAARAARLLKGKLTPKKEFDLNELISDLKLEVGDRGAAEAMPKKEFDENVAFRKRVRSIQENIKNAPMPQIKAPFPAPPISQKKGGKIKSKYSKGGGVRSAKYKI